VKPPAETNGRLFYAQLIVITVLILSCLVAVVTVLIARPEQDNMIAITAIIGFSTVTLTSVLALVASKKNAGAIQEVHYSLNSRLSQLLQETKDAATGAEKTRAGEEKASELLGAKKEKERQSGTAPQ
jgi:hypothetical protein